MAQAPGVAPTVVRNAILESRRPMSVSSDSGHDGELRFGDAAVICRTAVPCTGVSVVDGIPAQAPTLTMDRIWPKSPAVDIGGADLIPGGATDLAGTRRRARPNWLCR